MGWMKIKGMKNRYWGDIPQDIVDAYLLKRTPGTKRRLEKLVGPKPKAQKRAFIAKLRKRSDFSVLRHEVNEAFRGRWGRPAHDVEFTHLLWFSLGDDRPND